DARAIIASRLERDEVESRFRAPAPSASAIADFLATYRHQDVRLVSTTEPAPWLGGTTKGWVVATLAPGELFALTGSGKIDTADGTFEVTRASPATPLGLLPHGEGAAPAHQALSRLTLETIYRGWLRDEETKLLATASCLNDQVPDVGETDLSPFVPFLFAAS